MNALNDFLLYTMFILAIFGFGMLYFVASYVWQQRKHENYQSTRAAKGRNTHGGMTRRQQKALLDKELEAYRMETEPYGYGRDFNKAAQKMIESDPVTAGMFPPNMDGLSVHAPMLHGWNAKHVSDDALDAFIEDSDVIIPSSIEEPLVEPFIPPAEVTAVDLKEIVERYREQVEIEGPNGYAYFRPEPIDENWLDPTKLQTFSKPAKPDFHDQLTTYAVDGTQPSDGFQILGPEPERIAAISPSAVSGHFAAILETPNFEEELKQRLIEELNPKESDEEVHVDAESDGTTGV